ncbi:MAG: LysM peptidoglycan-binding domain-containing protein [Caldilineaceae bacterium]
MRVDNWQTIDFGEIQSRTEPSGVRTYTVQFTAPSSEIVLFLRGWKKWAISEVEMDLNFDEISLRNCGESAPAYKPASQTGGYICTYTVQPGDVLSLIAQNNWVSVHDLMIANNIGNPNLIYVGQVLQIPGCNDAPVAVPVPLEPRHEPKPAYEPKPEPKPAPAPTQQRVHVVAPGETLSYICDLYGVDVNTLAYVNNIANVNFIYVGQEIVIP